MALLIGSCEAGGWTVFRTVDWTFAGDEVGVRSSGGNDETRSGNSVYMKELDERGVDGGLRQ